MSNLGNPKMAMFFSSLLPQFAEDFAGLALHGLIFAAITFAWLAGYACLSSHAGEWVRCRSIRRTIEAVTGAALVVLGLRLAAEQR